jgi:uncharacterized phage protein (TIGR01671 family)
MREIKFRAWGPNSKYMWSWEELVANGIPITWLCGATDFHGERIIMQYTGLKDKNGKEIYEKDYLKAVHPDVEFNHLGYVQYNDEVAAFDVYISMPLLEYDEFEIIGNIYENPELLKDETI